MTDSIDLDDIDVQDDEEPERNAGDWLWKGEGAPESEPDDESEGVTGDDLGERTPRVPRETDGSPVGIPKAQGGAGSGVGESSGTATRDTGGEGESAGRASPGVPGDESEDSPNGGPDGSVSGPVGSGQAGSGPHGGGADDMTFALTYRAAKELSDPAAVFSDAARWSDWVGLVGDVPSHVLNKFQREHVVDLDFFNGSGTTPTERLAEIGPSSMFYAERMVLVGLDDEAGMEPEGWEFRPLDEAASKAGWERA